MPRKYWSRLKGQRRKICCPQDLRCIVSCYTLYCIFVICVISQTWDHVHYYHVADTVPFLPRSGTTVEGFSGIRIRVSYHIGDVIAH